MKKRTMYVSMLTLSSALLVSCSSLSGPPSVAPPQGAQAENVPLTRLPPHVHTAAPFTNYYPLPPRTYPKATAEISLIPPGL